jgi:transposase-like protein
VSKDGHANGKQQHKCKDCGRRFTEGATVVKYPQRVRNEVVSLYCEGMSFGAIARAKGIKKNTVFQWIKKKGSGLTNTGSKR